MYIRALTLLFRLWSSLAKTFSIFFISKYISTTAAGEFTLILSVIVIGIYLIGIDFYTFSNREVLKRRSNIKKSVINDSYLAFIIILVLIPIFSYIPDNYLGNQNRVLVFMLIVTEFFGMQGARYLIILKKPLSSAVSVFFRFGLWMSILVLAKLVSDFSISIDFLIKIWIIFNTASIVFISFMIIPHFDSSERKLDYKWIKRGIGVSLVFFIGTITQRFFFNIDRFYIESNLGLEILAVYAAYFSIAAGITVFVDSLVLMHSYPLLVEKISQDRARSNNIKNSVLFSVSAVCFFCVIGITFIFPYLSSLFDDELFDQNKVSFWFLVGSFVIYNLSQVYYYTLYALNKEMMLTLINIIGLLGFFGFLQFLNLNNTLEYVAIAFSCSIFFISSSRLIVGEYYLRKLS